MNAMFHLSGLRGSQAIQNGRARTVFTIVLTLLLVLAFPGLRVQAQPVVIATISFGGSRAGVIGANPNTNKVYVAREDDPSIAVIDGATNTVTTTIPTSGFHTGLAVNPATNRIYVSQQFSGSVRVIDGSTNTVITDFGVPGLVHTVGDVAVNPATNKIYVIRADNQDISVHDGVTHAQLTAVSCMGSCHSGELAVNPVTNRIYVTTQDTNSVTVIDGATDTVVTTISVGDQPRSIEVNPVTNLIYVTNIVSNTLSVIDGATNTVVATVAMGANPYGVTVNPQTNRIYVADFGGNDVSIVNGDTNTVLATVPVGLSPAGLAILPGLSRVYVSQGDHSVAVIEDLYSFTGFFQPVDNPGPGPAFVFNIAKAGSAIPIKFSLGGNQGLNIFASGSPGSQQINCDASASLDTIEQTITAGSSSLSYNAATDQYTYVWKTDKAWGNSCRQLVVKLNDGTSHIAYFKFTK